MVRGIGGNDHRILLSEMRDDNKGAAMKSPPVVREITVPVSIKPTVEHRRERIRVDIQPGNRSLIVEKDGSIHE